MNNDQQSQIEHGTPETATTQQLDPSFVALLGEANKTEAQEQVEQLPPLELPAELDEARIKLAEEAVKNGAGMLFFMLQQGTGRSYNLDEKAAAKLAKGVAPCLVKYGVGEPSALLLKWKIEIDALMAVGALSYGIYRAHNDYQKQEQEAATNGNQPQ